MLVHMVKDRLDGCFAATIVLYQAPTGPSTYDTSPKKQLHCFATRVHVFKEQNDKVQDSEELIKLLIRGQLTKSMLLMNITL